jgi:hypothetical protein
MRRCGRIAAMDNIAGTLSRRRGCARRWKRHAEHSWLSEHNIMSIVPSPYSDEAFGNFDTIWVETFQPSATLSIIPPHTPVVD